MLNFRRIYCQFPIDSKTSTSKDTCGKFVEYSLELDSKVSILLCEEHKKLLEKDKSNIISLIKEIYHWLLENYG